MGFLYVFVILYGCSGCFGQYVDYHGRPRAQGEPLPLPEVSTNCASVKCPAVTTCVDGSVPVRVPGECCDACQADGM